MLQLKALQCISDDKISYKVGSCLVTNVLYNPTMSDKKPNLKLTLYG